MQDRAYNDRPATGDLDPSSLGPSGLNSSGLDSSGLDSSGLVPGGDVATGLVTPPSTPAEPRPAEKAAVGHVVLPKPQDPLSSTQIITSALAADPGQTLDLTREKKKLAVSAKYNASHAAEDWADAGKLGAGTTTLDPADVEPEPFIPRPEPTTHAATQIVGEHPQIRQWATAAPERDGVVRQRPLKGLGVPMLVLFNSEGLPGPRWPIARLPYTIGPANCDFTLPEGNTPVRVEISRDSSGTLMVHAQAGTLYRKLQPRQSVRLQLSQQFAIGLHRLKVVNAADRRRGWLGFGRGKVELRVEAQNMSTRQTVALDMTRDGVMFVGTDQASDLVLQNDPYADRNHAEIAVHLASQALELSDAGSFNGTYAAVSGPQPLTSGDLFLLRSLMFGVVW